KIERELDAVESFDVGIRQDRDAAPIRGDRRLDVERPEVVEDCSVLRVQTVLADAQVHRAHGKGPTNVLDVGEREALDGDVGPVASGTGRIALVGEADTHGECGPCGSPPRPGRGTRHARRSMGWVPTSRFTAHPAPTIRGRNSTTLAQAGIAHG